MKPIPELNANLEDWLILADYYEDIQYDHVVKFIKTTMKDWIEWLEFNPYWFVNDVNENCYAWINENLRYRVIKEKCYLPRELYYRICPLQLVDYEPEVIFKSKEEAYFTLFLAWLEEHERHSSITEALQHKQAL